MRLHWIVGLLASVIGAAPAAAFDLPPRKPGLWELSQTTNIGPSNSRTEIVRHCVDSDTDALLRRLEMMSLQQAKCSRMDLRREGEAIVLDAECKAGETEIATRAVTRGDFDAQYTGTLHIRRLSTPAWPTVPPEMTIVTVAKRIGLCTADMRPGDVVMPNGLTTSIYDLPGMPPAPAAAPIPDFVLPARTPGLWELKTTVEGNSEQPPIVTLCVDAEIDRELNRLRFDKTCSPPRIESGENSTTVHWNCRTKSESARMRLVVAGDFRNAYTIAITRGRDIGLPHLTGDSRQKTEGRWLGACPAGQTPGQVAFPDGRMVHFRDLK
jgi:hypothetical protein